MTTYAILISGDEEAWAKRTEAELTAVGEARRAFVRSLTERGHRVTAPISAT